MRPSSDPRPNILILMTDQQRFDTIAATGHSWMKTPNLDRLVHEGCTFTNAYTPNPICVPARHCFLTGTTERYHGLTDNSFSKATLEGLPTLPKVLSDHGYFTAAVGKMHFRPPRRHHGFLEMHLMEEIPVHQADDAYAQWLAAKGREDVRILHGARPLVYHEQQQALVPEALHGCQFVAEQTIETIERQAGRRPWYIHASWIKPHPPFNIPANWLGHYDDVELPMPVGGRKPPAWTEPSEWFGDTDNEETVRRIRAAYYTTISMVDAAVGRVLDYLESSGVLDNTMIIFTSDHGEMLGDHGLYQKMQPFEPSSHVPMVIRYPKHWSAGSRESRFVDLMDVMPTCLDAAGIDMADVAATRPWQPAGDSLLRLGDEGGRDRSIQRSAFGQGPERWAMVRDERYKYVHFAHGGVEHLYDLVEDPHEQRNLIETGRVPTEALARLRAQCIQMETEWGPKGAVVDGRLHHEPMTEPGPLGFGGKYPAWANGQVPQFGNGTGDEEALLLTDQIVEAMAHQGQGAIAALMPNAEWPAHFFTMLEHRYAPSEATRREVARRLGLEQCL